MEYYKVTYQEKPEIKVIVEKVVDSGPKCQFSTVYSYAYDGKSGLFAIMATKEEAFSTLKDSIKCDIETHKKCIEDAEKKLEVISKYEPSIDESITKPEPKFKIGDKVIKAGEYRENDKVTYPVLTVVDRLWDPIYESYYYTVTGNGMYDNKIFCEKVLESISDIYDKLDLNTVNITKKDGVRAFRSFKAGDVVTNGYDKYIVKDIYKDGHSYLIEEPDYSKPDEERVTFWIKEDRLRFWKKPKFNVSDLVKVKNKNITFRIENITLNDYVWQYGWFNPSDTEFCTQWEPESNLALILEPDTKPQTEPVYGDTEDVKITIDNIIENKLDEKIANLRNELLDCMTELVNNIKKLLKK